MWPNMIYIEPNVLRKSGGQRAETLSPLTYTVTSDAPRNFVEIREGSYKPNPDNFFFK
jgi:hypothetical protein